MRAIRVLWQAFRLEAALSRRSPGHLLILVVAAIQSTTLISLALAARRPDAVVNGVLAPGLTGLWIVSLNLAGGVIVGERWGGRFELLVVSPTPLALVVFGRVFAVMLFGAVTFGEAWLIAAFGFGHVVTVGDPVTFAVGVAATVFAMAGTATFLASAFVLSRAMNVLQNSISYPFYILGGVFVPVAALPGWLAPLSRLVFLSWSGDLLRNALRGGSSDRIGPLLAIVGLGTAALIGGLYLTRYVVDRARRDASVGYT
jgi:ABC-2 type transport system permease protein